MLFGVATRRSLSSECGENSEILLGDSQSVYLRHRSPAIYRGKHGSVRVQTQIPADCVVEFVPKEPAVELFDRSCPTDDSERRDMENNASVNKYSTAVGNNLLSASDHFQNCFRPLVAQVCQQNQGKLNFIKRPTRT